MDSTKLIHITSSNKEVWVNPTELSSIVSNYTSGGHVNLRNSTSIDMNGVIKVEIIDR